MSTANTNSPPAAKRVADGPEHLFQGLILGEQRDRTRGDEDVVELLLGLERRHVVARNQRVRAFLLELREHVRGWVDPLDARLRTVCVVFRSILAGLGASALYFTVTCYDEDSGAQAKPSETDLAG